MQLMHRNNSLRLETAQSPALSDDDSDTSDTSDTSSRNLTRNPSAYSTTLTRSSRSSTCSSLFDSPTSSTSSLSLPPPDDDHTLTFDHPDAHHDYTFPCPSSPPLIPIPAYSHFSSLPPPKATQSGCTAASIFSPSERTLVVTPENSNKADDRAPLSPLAPLPLPPTPILKPLKKLENSPRWFGAKVSLALRSPHGGVGAGGIGNEPGQEQSGEKEHVWGLGAGFSGRKEDRHTCENEEEGGEREEMSAVAEERSCGCSHFLDGEVVENEERNFRIGSPAIQFAVRETTPRLN